MKIVASIQARLSSSRLPGKVLMELEGKPILQWQVERLSQSRLIDEVIVAIGGLSASLVGYTHPLGGSLES